MTDKVSTAPEDVDGDLICWVGCPNCGASVDYEQSENAAKAAWNRRTPPSKPEVEG